MLLLFVGGVMNLTVIAALTAFVAFEKLTPFRAGTTWISGALLIGAGVWTLVRQKQSAIAARPEDEETRTRR
jgi:predicted metal-binding membrane protein